MEAGNGNLVDPSHPQPIMPLFHTILVAAFLSVTAALLLLTIYQRVRVADPLLSWQAVSVMAAWPVTFVGMIGLLALYAANAGSSVPGWIFAGYVMGGGLWFASVVVGASVVVSRHGLVAGLGRRESALPWCQVTDYFEAQSGRKTHFVFLYKNGGQTEASRLDVPVPAAHLERFRLLVAERLEQRHIKPAERVRGPRATS
ncbi:MAG: hypothetical protein ACI9W4_000472 [Rhodothermales bacterium]|jgi:hypothetical protein